MDKFGIWSTFEAKPGREAEAEAFLRECAERISREPGTTTFFALKVGPGRYATFDTMRDDAALAAHVGGPTAAAVHARGQELFVKPPDITQATILAVKPPSGTPERR